MTATIAAAAADDDVAAGVSVEEIHHSLDELFDRSSIDNQGISANTTHHRGQTTKSWSGRFLHRVTSAILSPFEPMDETSRLAKYKTRLEACIQEHDALHRHAELDVGRLQSTWTSRLHRLASEGTSRADVERYRYLSHLLRQDMALVVEMETCILEILCVRRDECNSLLAESSAVQDIDAAFFTSPAALIESHPEVSMLRTRQAHLTRAVGHAYHAVAAMVSADASFHIQDALHALQALVGPDEDDVNYRGDATYAAFMTQLHAFRRAASDVRTTSGRLLRAWQHKLHHDVERIVAKETRGSEDGLAAARLFHASPPPLDADCILAIDTHRLPPPSTITAFEVYFARVVKRQLSDPVPRVFTIAIHHTIFATMPKLTSAYEDKTMFRHLEHAVLADRRGAGLAAPSMQDTAFRATHDALTRLCCELAPLGILGAVLHVMRCLHADAASWCPSMNADVLIPLLVFVLTPDASPPRFLATIYRRLHVAATFASAYVNDGAEVVYYLTCMQAAVAHVHGATIADCPECNDRPDESWRDLGATDERHPVSRSDADAIAELSAWIGRYTVSDSTLSIVAKEEWML
ncbi:Aste57867_8889 [Aphanomyces stellatus]|uniref:Aste57867_8889 protein n=1 Tax=Aphanomyces stellatus TaxID=120398 RepID=A0A485KLH0_9STRA|nr:hypothetical protein As57867_008854 [Aphanomyces stellatus]VFT85773.1 Aste57867_8889 [Aphanomyces stellatus]